MISPAILSAMTANVLIHSEKHIKTALDLCARIAKGEGDYQTRQQEATQLILKIRVIKSDMERVLLFITPDE